jgi:hypothetical protein
MSNILHKSRNWKLTDDTQFDEFTSFLSHPVLHSSTAQERPAIRCKHDPFIMLRIHKYTEMDENKAIYMELD